MVGQTPLRWGGVDPRKSQLRRELLKQGVPLAARSSVRAKRKARPTRISLLTGKFAYVKKHSLKIKLSRRARWAEQSRLLKIYGRLSEDDRAEYIHAERRAAVDKLDHLEDPDEVYARTIGEKLFGLSSRTSALREAVCLDGIRRTCPDLGQSGMRNYAPKLRQWCVSHLAVQEQEAIPKKTKLVGDLPCGLAHPGLCPGKTPAIYERGLQVASNIISYALGSSKVGQAFKLVTEPAVDEFFAVVGYIRRSDPRLVCVVRLDRLGEASLDVRVADGMAACMVASEIAAELLLAQPGLRSIKLYELQTRLISGRLCHLDVQGASEAGLELLVDDVPAAAAPHPVDHAADGVAARILSGFLKLNAKPVRQAVPKLAEKFKKVVFDEEVSSSTERDYSAESTSGDEPMPPKMPVTVVPAATTGAASSSSSGGAASSSSSGAASSSSVGKAPAVAGPAVAPAVAPPAVAKAAGRQLRGEPWGPFSLAAVTSFGMGVGWGATCARHHNEADSSKDVCKKQLTYGGGRTERLSDAQCRLLLKRWLYAGRDLHLTPTQRGDHVDIQPRGLTEPSEAELDAWAAALAAG